MTAVLDNAISGVCIIGGVFRSYEGISLGVVERYKPLKIRFIKIFS